MIWLIAYFVLTTLQYVLIMGFMCYDDKLNYPGLYPTKEKWRDDARFWFFFLGLIAAIPFPFGIVGWIILTLCETHLKWEDPFSDEWKRNYL